jgi:multiple sugar transport system ATP-binding protein
MKRGILQQIASPRELYEQPVNLFVAGFIGSPPMNFIPAEIRGDSLDTPLGSVALTTDRQRQAVQGHDLLLMGIRPEAFEDARLVEADKKDSGEIFHAQVDVTEWLGNEQYAYVPFDTTEEVSHQLRDLSRELDSDQLRTQLTVSIDASSRIRPGRTADIWVDTRKMHLFDPKSGVNLTRDEEAGARLTAEVEEERREEIEEARHEREHTMDLRDSAPASGESGGTQRV